LETDATKKNGNKKKIILNIGKNPSHQQSWKNMVLNELYK